MTPYYDQDGITIYVGDNRDVLPHLENISAVVTDPPAGISFMGKEWDGSKGGRDNWVAWLSSVMSGCERAMKPGAHALVWALPRTSGWTHRAIEDAGLDVRDCVTHLYGSGFPKSHNLSGDWQGWGTALKPGAEFWYLARKPLCGTVANNVLQHGTGALNIDASRIATDELKPYSPGLHRDSPSSFNDDAWRGREQVKPAPAGRWPANVILDEESAMLLDAQSGVSKSQRSVRVKPGGVIGNGNTHGRFVASQENVGGFDDTGGASRFFKTVKHEENDRTYADFMVQYDCNCEAVEGDQWVKQDRNPSIQQDADTPPQRDTTATPSGTASEGAPCLHTSSSGSGTTGQSLTDTRCITSTVTSRTTGSKTCNCSTRQRTSASTQDVNFATANGGNPASSAASSSESTPNIGTSAKRDGRSTDGADNAISAKSLPINSGNAARFRYVAKASRAERRRGLPDDMDANHPTVKPLALMRYLVTLITPPGGIVLDPFAGSGSTLVACAELGIPAIGIEMNEEYAEIAARRVRHAQQQTKQAVLA